MMDDWPFDDESRRVYDGGPIDEGNLEDAIRAAL